MCDVYCRTSTGIKSHHIKILINGMFFVFHDDVIKWERFPRYWPFVRGIHRSPVNSPHKGQWRGDLGISLICAWINGWVNTREAGDLGRHRPHCDVIVMLYTSPIPAMHPPPTTTTTTYAYGLFNRRMNFPHSILTFHTMTWPLLPWCHIEDWSQLMWEGMKRKNIKYTWRSLCPI